VIKIENKELLVEIKSAGAEMTRIYSKKTQLEYLWKGAPTFWGRHAPVLFPIVGQVKNKTYKVDGDDFHLPQHGFARDNEFKLLTQEEDEVTFELTDSDEIAKVYPFKFTLLVNYRLSANELFINYKVINKDDKEIMFSIGGHPAFNCPLVEGTSFDDYYLEFPEKETPQQIHLNMATGLRNGLKDLVKIGSKVELNYDLFKNDALIYEGLKSSEVSLKSSKHKHGLTFQFADWKYLAFWTKEKNAPFICIEPWCGITDEDNSKGDFIDKLAIEKLAVEKRFSVEYSVKLF
jgi:galactose mutarotase-like enzyme